MKYFADKLRKKIAEGELIIGAHSFFTDPAITEAFGCHGFDFVWIDGEHSAFDKASTLTHIMAARSAGCASLVRIPWNDPVLVKPVLEMGPDMILFPMVCTPREAKKAVESCRYPPKGQRGFGPRRANDYGAMETKEYLKQAEQSFLRIIQIEHVLAVKNLEEIIEVDGIDLILVGPNDLSASIGRLGDTKHPEVIALYEKIIDTCQKAKFPFAVSVGAGDQEAIAYWIKNGVRLIACGDDISYLHMGCENTFNLINNLQQ